MDLPLAEWERAVNRGD